MTTQFSPVNIEHRKNMDIRAGDTVRVWIKVLEKGKTRLQPFEGLVLARKHGSEPGATFTVRRVSGGVGIEKIFPLYSPNIEKIELIKRSKARRSKMYYVREKAAREIKKKMRALNIDLSTFSSEEEPEKPAEEEGEENKKEEKLEETKDTKPEKTETKKESPDEEKAPEENKKEEVSEATTEEKDTEEDNEKKENA